MEQGPSVEIRPRRRRVERGKRSKNGCRTCNTKRVKCDEQHPRCSRCLRLGLPCEWPSAVPSLAERRRGAGPIKYRDRTAWAPREIQPESSGQRTEPAEADEEFPRQHGLPPTELTLPTIYADAYASGAAGQIADEEEPEISASRALVSSSVDQLTLPVLDWNIFTTSTSFLEADANGSSSSSNCNDVLALEFHRTIFAYLRSTRDPTKSSHFTFSHHALKMPIALHLLLAVSHSELVIYQGQGAQTPQESLLHFGLGSNMLLQRLTSTLDSGNHAEVMLSYLYLYHFWLRRDQWNLQKLQDLSMSILLYVKTWALDEACSLAYRQSSVAGHHSVEYGLVAKILTYLFDRDGFCAYSGFAGALCTDGIQNQAVWQDIWHLSQLAFPPPSSREVAVLECYYQLIWIHHQINCYSQSFTESTEMERSILRRMQSFRRVCSACFLG
jgi:hypothetical protein